MPFASELPAFLFLSFLFVILFLCLLCWLHIGTQRANRHFSLRELILLTAIVVGVIVVVLTELLSFFSALTPMAVRWAWGIIWILAVGSAAWYINKDRTIFSNLWGRFTSGLHAAMSASWPNRWLLLLIVIHVLVLLVLNFMYPVPNNVDSMAYHLARILYWEAQSSVSHFATHYLPQISFPPFAEFVLLHVIYLQGSDLYLGTFQWMAMLLSLVGVSEFARKLNGDTVQQIVAALLCVSIPQGILEAATTQNDYVAALWLICFVVFGLRFIRESEDIFISVPTGFALGFALLTKGTTFFYAFPLSLWIGGAMLVQGRFSARAWRAGVVVVLAAVALNAGHFVRNQLVFGIPFGTRIDLANTEISPATFASNVIRNVQIHAPPPSGSGHPIINSIGVAFASITYRLHQFTGLDPLYPPTTVGLVKQVFEDPDGLSFNENAGGSFVQIILILVALPVMLWRAEPLVKYYGLALVAGFLLFSLILRMNIASARLHFPLLALWCPVIALVLFRLRPAVLLPLCLAIWALSIPWLVNSRYRPLFVQPEFAIPSLPNARVRPYIPQRGVFMAYDQIATLIVSQVPDCSRVGLILSPKRARKDYIREYPLWMLLKSKGYHGVVRHVQVNNASAELEDPSYIPCAVLSNRRQTGYPAFVNYKVGNYWLYLAP